MSRGLTKVLLILVATELVALAVVVAIVLHGDQRTEFPTSVPINGSVAKAANSSVPVSVNVRVIGRTQTAALESRGGQARTLSTGSDTGYVSNSRSTTTTTASAETTPTAPSAP